MNTFFSFSFLSHFLSSFFSLFFFFFFPFCLLSLSLFFFFPLLSKLDPSQGSSSFRRWQNLTSLLSWIHFWNIQVLQFCLKAKSNSLVLCSLPPASTVFSGLGIISYQKSATSSLVSQQIRVGDYWVRRASAALDGWIFFHVIAMQPDQAKV